MKFKKYNIYKENHSPAPMVFFVYIKVSALLMNEKYTKCTR